MIRARAKPEDQASALLCCVDGCSRRWVTDYGRRLCIEHGRNPKPNTKPLALPMREAVRPHAEQPEHDQEEF